ncbi:MAG: hypothetical protein IJA73_00160 [Oscillospiraceae bacterium]|nr:hypothetical protein [Oscillospiraceae bacterium]
MQQLLEITSVPIELEFKSTRARLEMTRSTVDMKLTRDKNGLNIKSSPIRVNIDTYEARNSIVPTIPRKLEQDAQAGQQAAYEATASYAQQGQLLLKARIGEDVIGRLAAEAVNDYKENVGIKFLPTTGPNISFDGGEMTIRYEMDKLNFDWKLNGGGFEFTPADIEISVKQRPSLTIKYVGGPIYVPRSADPNYEPVDVKA